MAVTTADVELTSTGPKGAWARITTVDHKRVGMLYAVSAAVGLAFCATASTRC